MLGSVEPFSEETGRDAILLPSMIKKLRGRLKKQMRRVGWEGAGEGQIYKNE